MACYVSQKKRSAQKLDLECREMYIDVSNVSISFEENKEQHTILNDVSLQVEKGEFICLLGPSGCGDYVKIRLS